MIGHGVPVLAGDALERALEGGVLERLDAPAAVAHEMVVMVRAVGVGGLVPGDAVADVDALDETQLVEGLDHAVDRRDADVAAVAADAVEDLLCGQTAGLPAEMIDHGMARATMAEPCRAERRERVLGPGDSLDRHVQMITALNVLESTP